MAWVWLGVLSAAISLAVASLRGRWLFAALPFGAFAWGFGHVVLRDPNDGAYLSFHLVWLLALVALEASLAIPPTSDSWWVTRYRSWTGWRRNPAGVMASLVGAWVALSAVPLLGWLLGWAVMVVTAWVLGVFIVKTVMAVVSGGRDAEQLAVTAGSAALPVAAVLAAFFGRAFIFGF